MRDGHCAMYSKLKKKLKKKDKKKKQSQKKKEEETGGSVREKGEREKGIRIFRFSLRSTEIGQTVFVGARGKVHPRIESYAWVPKS